MIQSHLQYCIPVWGGIHINTLNPLIKLQKKTLRIMHQVNQTTHTQQLFTDTGILQLRKLCIYRSILAFLRSPTQVEISRNQSTRLGNRYKPGRKANTLRAQLTFSHQLPNFLNLVGDTNIATSNKTAIKRRIEQTGQIENLFKTTYYDT